MRISELIKVLEKDLQKHGDRRVLVYPQDKIQMGCNYEISMNKMSQYKSKEFALFRIYFC